MLYYNSMLAYLKNHPTYVKLFFAIFYLVGIIGLITPLLFPLFIKLIPMALLLSIFALVIFHEGILTTKTTLIFLTVYVVSFFVEVVGVETHIIFGQYHYGSGLGFKLFNTPLMIGLNWLLMVYTSASIVKSFKLNGILSVFIGSTLMLIYDVVLEQIAPITDMWYWHENQVPMQNYIAWFLVAFIFQSSFRAFKITYKNKLAAFIFICQFLFFISLLLIFKFAH